MDLIHWIQWIKSIDFFSIEFNGPESLVHETLLID